MSAKNIVDLRGGKPRKVVSSNRPRPVSSRPAPLPSKEELRLDARRASPLRARRQKLRVVAILFFVALLGALIYGVSYISYLPRYTISAIDVTGATTVPAPMVSEYVQSQLFTGAHPFLSSANIFLYHRVGLQNEIVGYFPRIKSATITRDSLFSTTLHVAIVERESYARWCTDVINSTDCYQMDSDGYIFAQSPEATSTVTYTTSYIFGGAISTSTSPITQSFESAHISGIVALLKKLTDAGYRPTGATVTNDQDFVVNLADGFAIKASFGEDSSTVVHNLQLVLGSTVLANKKDTIEYVDLRFGDRVYYKLKGEIEATSSTSTNSQ